MPFKSHWSDWLIAKIDSARLPWSLFYLLMFLGLGLGLNLVSWVFGIREPGVLDINLFLPGFWFTAYLLANHILVNSGRTAFLRSSELFANARQDLESWRYQISHVPQTRGNVWALAGSLMGAIIAYYAGTHLDLAFDLPLSYLVLFAAAGTAFFLLAIFRIVYQMSIVVTIFDTMESINLYDLHSIYALALFPARIVVILLFTFWVNPIFLMFPDWLRDPWMQAVWIIISLGASASVIAPLRGIRAKLRSEKETLLQQNANLLNLVREDLSHMVQTGDHHRADALEKEVAALFAFRESIENISTMPWKPETIRWLATALLLPLSLWIIQFFLQRMLAG